MNHIQLQVLGLLIAPFVPLVLVAVLISAGQWLASLAGRMRPLPIPVPARRGARVARMEPAARAPSSLR